MTLDPEATTPQQGKWDPLTGELHKLRVAAGTPTYAVLTRMLIEQRMAGGQDAHEARIAKSSVHDAFRFGRSRINQPLLEELVQVMGGDPAMVATWATACLVPPASAWTPPTATTPATPARSHTSAEAVTPPTGRQWLSLMIGCLVLNLIGREFVDFFNLPIYLDMVGTAIAAIALGPWRGAAVGATTNIVGMIGSGWISLPFALVNITGALVWGYGVRRFGMGRTLPRFFTLNLVTAATCSLVAVPIIVALGDNMRRGTDAITELVAESFDTFLVAVSFSNLLTSSGDKLVSGFVALVVISALPMSLRRGANLVAVEPGPPHTPQDSPEQSPGR